MEDARAAVAAVVERVPEAVQIGVFGSVARGHAKPLSDIDLLVVVEDLDYLADRPRLAGEVRSAARTATPYPVGVVLTDVTEWARRSSLQTALERDISRGLVTIHDEGDERHVPVAWEKAMEKASTDLSEAYVRLGEAAAAFNGALRWMSPSTAENRARRSKGDLHAVYLTHRHQSLLADLDMVLETSLKAMHHAVGESVPAWTHRLSVLADDLPAGPERSRVLEALAPLRVESLPPAHRGPDDLEEVFTNWRIHGTYSSASRAALYLPPERVDAYLEAADRIAVLTLEVLAGRSGGGVLENRREVVLHRAALTAMRRARSRYDTATGRRRRVGRFWGLSAGLPPVASGLATDIPLHPAMARQCGHRRRWSRKQCVLPGAHLGSHRYRPSG